MPRITIHRNSPDPQQRKANISRRIAAPTEFDFAFVEDDGNSYPALPEVKYRWSAKSRRYEVVDFRLVKRSDGEPITSQMLRQIPVGEITEMALNNVVKHHGEVRSSVANGSFSELIRQFHTKKDGFPAGKMTGEKLEWVSTLYEMSSALGNKPTQEVSNIFEVSLRTASNWIRQARAEGVLDSGSSS